MANIRPPSRSPWSRLSLQGKVFLLSFLLVTGLVGLLLLFSYQRANQLAQESLDEALASTRNLYENLELDRLEKLQLINSVAAESPYFKAAVAELDALTTLDSANDMVEQVGSDFMIVTDFEGVVVARTDAPSQSGQDLASSPLVDFALGGESVGGVWREGERLFHAVSVPLTVGPELLGSLTSGYEINDYLAQDIKKLAGCEVVFFAGTGEYRVAGSTLAETTGSLGQWLASESMPAAAENVRLTLSGEEYQAIFAPLETAGGEMVGVFAALRSRDRELAAFRTFQRSVLLVGLVGLALALVASHFVARGIAGPIRKLVTVTDRIRQGDYSSDVKVESGDEIGSLAASFRALLGELREKQLMEKYISKSAADMIQRETTSVRAARRRPVTVLFSDLRGYTALKNEEPPPSSVISRLNTALSRQAELVERYGGQVDKFVGDRMMAVFKGEERVWPAIRCAIAIQQLLDDGDPASDPAFLPGIGVSTGQAVFGTVGSAKRLDYTLLGPAVHVAGRLADEALPGDILLSKEAYDEVSERTSAEPLPPLKVHGLEGPVPVFLLSAGTIRQRTGAAATQETVATGEGSGQPSLVSLSSLEPGSELGKRYEIRRVLGSGGMGMVFQALDRDLDEPVALKVLRPEILSLDPQILDRFKTEIRVARRITHRNVVRTYDFGEVDGVKFISMEFVQGMTLKQLLRSRGALPRGVGLRIIKECSAGLMAAHEQGVIHRDVKPQNIMLTPQSEVKIMDFGIVREQEKGGVTQTGLIIGTPDYMSPEQAQGRPDIDQRSDIYSLGVVLYEVFTGDVPFKGDSSLDVAMMHVRDEARPPRSINPHISEMVEVIILRCMRKSPDSRYQTMAELHTALLQASAAVS